MHQKEPFRLIVGISGASGAIYGVRALDLLRAAGVETHLIVTRSAHLTLAQELSMRPADVAGKADVTHKVDDIGASVASGSFRTMGMLIAPCSVRTMSEIASGVTSSLMTRAADVVLKERRRLILVTRDTPLSLIHINNMKTVTEAGGIICPASPSFYSKPTDLESIARTVTDRVIDLAGLRLDSYRWGE